MGFRDVVAGIGRVLIAAGTLILLFVAYQLWGTKFAEERDQKALRKQLVAPVAAPDPGAAAVSLPGLPSGQAVAVIKIPKLSIEKAVVEGVGVGDLQKGPGHYPETPLPGQPGNAAIAGHRTTYGAPFYRLDELDKGDPILVTVRGGKTFDYVVDDKMVVSPSTTAVLDATQDNRLTLTTCNPRFSAAQRLIVVAHLQGQAVAPPPAPPAPPPGSTPLRPAVSVPRGGLSGVRADKGPAIFWGTLAALVWLMTWAVGRRWRRWPAYLVGVPVFLVVLFFFFDNFARFLPANI